jgi:hypothetical protein
LRFISLVLTHCPLATTSIKLSLLHSLRVMLLTSEKGSLQSTKWSTSEHFRWAWPVAAISRNQNSSPLLCWFEKLKLHTRKALVRFHNVCPRGSRDILLRVQICHWFLGATSSVHRRSRNQTPLSALSPINQNSTRNLPCWNPMTGSSRPTSSAFPLHAITPKSNHKSPRPNHWSLPHSSRQSLPFLNCFTAIKIFLMTWRLNLDMVPMLQ